MANKKPEIITDKTQMRKWSRAMRSQGKTIGFVPTMGYLHEGHISIIKEAHNHSDLVVVSIYVNPGQFSPSEDLSTYPSDFNGDIQKLMDVPGGVDVVFHPHNLHDYGTTNPSVKNVNGCGGVPGGVDVVFHPHNLHDYGTTNPSVKNVNGCGGGDEESDVGVVSCLENSGWDMKRGSKLRDWRRACVGRVGIGVATAVTKLFNIVDPDVAVFGKKDYQQLRIILRMVRDLDFAIKLIGSEVVRESDGLAMSSRNVYLSPEEREQIIDQESLVAVEEITSPVVFCVAAWFGKVRLIDKMEINM
ncbi:Pantoate--beta-alanine ligase [Morus notabilis]|uniref:Pantoate--beta-alanine ligase n=1 Tax=Morus notabilis TaxID=981085 RepID=W9S166_9ROSA|nr:Pantoate--beta-alanine ligase [Morus notabilis]